MSDFAYTRLEELDRSFLIYESPNSPMHVGAVQLYDGAALRGPAGLIDLDRVLDYVASRLHLIPRYRQRVESAPIDGHPIWVDDIRFNIHYHVRHTRLPRPGSERIRSALAHASSSDVSTCTNRYGSCGSSKVSTTAGSRS